MADLFISYSRKDKEFVQKLHADLINRERDIWVDFEDIPLSADWWAEIRTGIEESNAFVFVISPDSIVSEVCFKEISCAVDLNKRMIPVLYREVDAQAVFPEVASLNWIFFRDTDDFDDAVTKLINTIDVDLEWVSAHTRLTRRAMEWDRKNRNDSLLLRGDDLADAEALLIQIEKEPPLTDLIGKYIWDSRQSAVKRQRIVIGAITVGLIVAIVLGIFAFASFWRANREFQRAEANAATAWAAVEIADTERENARAAQKTAEANSFRAATAEALAYHLLDDADLERMLATSRQLAADALLNLNDDPELSVRLALHGLTFSYSEEAEEALRRALEVAGMESGSYLNAQPVETLQSLAESMGTRHLTTAECQQYLHRNGCPE